MRTDKSSCVIADNPNVQLDPEVYNAARGLSAKQRLILAEKYANWSAQLAASARQMDSTIIKDIPEPAQLPNGFILINLSKWRKERLYKMAKECRFALRDVFGWALTHASQSLEEEVRLTRITGLPPRNRPQLVSCIPDRN